MELHLTEREAEVLEGLVAAELDNWPPDWEDAETKGILEKLRLQLGTKTS